MLPALKRGDLDRRQTGPRAELLLGESSRRVTVTLSLEETMPDNTSWDQEDRWWRNNYETRPYATGRTYDELRPAYRYGYESGRHHMGRTWKDVQSDLRTGWDKFEEKGP